MLVFRVLVYDLNTSPTLLVKLFEYVLRFLFMAHVFLDIIFKYGKIGLHPKKKQKNKKKHEL